MNNYTDSKTFLEHCEAFIFKLWWGSQQITVVKDDNIISSEG